MERQALAKKCGALRIGVALRAWSDQEGSSLASKNPATNIRELALE